MNISYDYSELLNELKSDILEGLISENDSIKVIRSKKNILNGTGDEYFPIVDYYYNHHELEEFDNVYQVKQVSDVIFEMEEWSKII